MVLKGFNEMESYFDYNSVVSALIGGGLTMLGTIIAMKGTKKESKREDSRELVPLFYFLNSKAALLVKLGENPKSIPITKIIMENEVSDVRGRFSFATRALSLSEIGDINLFCNQLVLLENTRRECSEASVETYEDRINAYQKVLLQTLPLVIDSEKKRGIHILGEKLERYFSKNLK